jgi:hypothetical protein
VFQDGIWGEYYYIDPRFWMYYATESPLDKTLADPRYRVTIARREILYGSHCAVVQASISGGQQRVLRILCWVDLDHQYIIRKTKEDVLVPAPGGGTVDQVFLRSSVPSLLQIGGDWYCTSFSSVMSLPVVPKGSTVPSNGSNVVWFRQVSAQISEMKGRPSWVSASCTMKWPAGARVYNNATGKDYLVQRDGSLKEMH